MTGRVISTKMTRTLVIRRDYLHYIPKYSESQTATVECSRGYNRVSLDRYEKRHKNLSAHVSPAFRVDIGDIVTVGACSCLRRIARTPHLYYRTVPAIVKDCPFQRSAGVEEQGGSQDLQQVLSGPLLERCASRGSYVYSPLLSMLCYACIKMTITPCAVSVSCVCPSVFRPVRVKLKVGGGL